MNYSPVTVVSVDTVTAVGLPSRFEMNSPVTVLAVDTDAVLRIERNFPVSVITVDTATPRTCPSVRAMTTAFHRGCQLELSIREHWSDCKTRVHLNKSIDDNIYYCYKVE